MILYAQFSYKGSNQLCLQFFPTPHPPLSLVSQRYRQLQSTPHRPGSFPKHSLFPIIGSCCVIKLFIMQFRALLITALLLSSSLSVKIFLFGGILVADNNPAYAKLAEQTGKPTRKNCNQNWDTTDCPRVAVVTSACEDSQCGYEEYYQGDGEQVATGQFFIDLGMVPRHISVQIDNYEEATNFFNSQGFQYLQWLNQADVIYFNGGDQSRHVRCWFNDNGTPNPFFSVIRQRVLNNQVILVGVSAGTAVQSKYTFGGGSSFGILYFTNSPGLAPLPISLNQGLYDFRNGTDCLQYSQNGGYLPGFGFIDFQVDTHFDRRGRLGRLIPALAQLNQTIGVGIDQYACLYYKDGVGTVYGRNGAFVADITGVSKLKSSYFQIKNAKLHYLTAGDSFDFKTKKMSTKKAAISAPSQNGFADSDNILAKYECTRLVARLVDQRGSENLGRTVVPAGEDYPQGTPTFDLLFYKNAQTKGYKSGGAISAENVSVDYSAEVRASA